MLNLAPDSEFSKNVLTVGGQEKCRQASNIRSQFVAIGPATTFLIYNRFSKLFQYILGQTKCQICKENILPITKLKRKYLKNCYQRLEITH